jgi:hypothetical protein
VRRYRFTALITFDPAWRPGAAANDVGRTRACYLIEPRDRVYFPAVIASDARTMPAVRAVVSIALVDGEDVAFFAPGQRFTIWADAIVGHTIRAHGRVGSGVIAGRAAPPRPGADDGAGRARGHDVVASGVPTAPGRGQRLVV